MLKILRTTLRQPCGLAKRKMVLRLPQEIPQKCVRRQVHGCRRADVKRALELEMISKHHHRNIKFILLKHYDETMKRAHGCNNQHCESELTKNH